MTTIDCSNGILEVGVKFAVELYLERKGVDTGWFHKCGIDQW